MTKFWTTSAGRRTWKRKSSALSATPRCVLPKTSCEFCALCASPRASSTPSSPQPWPPSKRFRRRFPHSRRAPDRIRFHSHVDVGVKMAEAICRRLRFSNGDTEQIRALVDNHMRFGDVEKMKASTFKRFVRLPRFDEHLELHRLDCMASHRKLRMYDYTRQKIAALTPECIHPKPLVN